MTRPMIWRGVVLLGVAIAIVAIAILSLRPGRSSLEGAEAAIVPDFAFENGDGETVHLADFRGKTILLNFWATWCIPCREEMPTLDRLQAELGGADFEVVAMALDRAGVDAVSKFYSEFEIINLAVYADRSAVSFQTLKFFGLPSTVLIDIDGREVTRVVGPAEWDSAENVAMISEHLPLPASGLNPNEATVPDQEARQ